VEGCEGEPEAETYCLRAEKGTEEERCHCDYEDLVRLDVGGEGLGMFKGSLRLKLGSDESIFWKF